MSRNTAPAAPAPEIGLSGIRKNRVDVCQYRGVLKGVLKEQYDKLTVTADRTGVTISIELDAKQH